MQLPFLDIGGVWRLSYFFALAAFSVPILWKLPLPLPARLLALYTLLSALFIVEYPAVHFGELTASYQATAGSAVIELVLVTLFAFRFRKLTAALMPYLAALSVLCVWFNWPGLLHAPSFNSAFAALAESFCPAWLGIIIWITALTHHGGTAILILAVKFVIFDLPFLQYSRNWAPFFVAMGLLSYCAGTHSGHLFDGGERLQRYQEYLAFWAKEPRWVILGVGPGSFVWTAMLLDHFKAPLFLQMHSDWLQILWELGLVGFGLSVWVFFSAVRSAWARSPRIVAGLFGLAAFGLTYYPLRFLPTALLTALIFAEAFSYRKD